MSKVAWIQDNLSKLFEKGTKQAFWYGIEAEVTDDLGKSINLSCSQCTLKMRELVTMSLKVPSEVISLTANIHSLGQP